MTTTIPPTARTAAVGAPTPPSGSAVHPRRAAVIAGIGYVVLFVLALFANFVVREGLIVTGDAAATAANIGESEGLFRLGLFSFVGIFAIDVVVAWALYIVFRSTNRDLSLVTAWFRLVYTILLGVALVFFFQALQLLDGANYLAAFSSEQLNAQALVALDTFNSTWLIGLLAFGVHLVFLGYLAMKSGTAPTALGFVLMVAGTTYVIDTVAHSLLANYNDYAGLFVAIVAVPAIIGEGWFGLWLLLKGGKQQGAHAPSRTVHAAD
jgi:hypothetical protein